ncbi:MAG: SGNH hydrolase domain-containing protein [Ornithinibacter sp.]
MSSETLTHPDVAPAPTRRQRRTRFRGDIEGLRALAVVLVVAFHAGVGAVTGGFVGVDVFFVLSGFLITGLLVDEMARTGTISLGDFYARRVRRLLPLATLVLAATAAATYALVPPIDRKGVAGDIIGSALWSANWRFAAESTQYMADTDKSPVLHYWSLAVEEQFYLVWPLLLLLLVGTTGLALRAWPVVLRRIALALGVVIVASLWLSWKQTDATSPFAYFGLHTRAWELGVGAALALARPLLPMLTRRAAEGAALLGVAMVLGSALAMDESTPFPGTAATVPVLGTALLIAAGARLPDGVVSSTLSRPVPRYVGRVSYAWYLWHWPVLVLATATWGEETFGDDGTATSRASWSVVALAVAISFVLAAASHHLVEQPLRKVRFLTVSRRRSLVAGGVLVATSLAASVALVVSVPASGEDSTVAAPQSGATAPGPTEAKASPADAKETPADAKEGPAARPTAGALVVDPAALREPNTPKEARADEPRGVSPCYVGYAPTAVPPSADCRVGPASGAERTIALIGDSHATAWYPALRKAAEERGWTLYFFGKSGCAVVDVTVLRPGTTSAYDACTTWREHLLDRLESIDGLDAVVIGRWMAYRGSTLRSDGSPVTSSTVGAVWEAGAERTFDRLRGVTSRIVVMEDVPWPGGDVPSCLSEHRRDVEACSFSRSRSTRLDAVLVGAEEAAAPKAVRHVDMTDVICPTKRCQVVSATGQIMYRDEHHLTAGFSASMWPGLAKRLEAAMG